IIAGGSAYPRILDFQRFRQIADSVSALLLVDMAHFSGLFAAGLHRNPCRWADIGTSSTHKTPQRPPADILLTKAQYGPPIDNTIPFDVNPPVKPSGIRLGSPAVTTRGFREPEMRETAALIAEVLGSMNSETAVADVRRKVQKLTDRFPLYSWKLERTPAAR